MNKFMWYSLFCILTAVLLSVAEPVFAQQSTTGPIPPPGLDPGIRSITRAQVVIPGVPACIWHHGCGPTAVGMVVGYYDGKGCVNLVPGDASTQTAAVDAMIADDRSNPDCSAPDGDHYQDYSCPMDAYPDLLADMSETGGAHASNCVADFFMTSWSSWGNYYGWSWFSDVPSSFTGYVNWITPHYHPVASNRYFSGFNWSSYKAEINANRPVVLLVDTDGNGDTDHFVTGIGYDDATMEYGIYNTWDTNIHWYLWRGMQVGNTWGIYGVTLFRLSFKRGDANADGAINSADVSYLINYLFVSGPKPIPLEAGDPNGDGTTNSADVSYLINYLFVSGPPPITCGN